MLLYNIASCDVHAWAHFLDKGHESTEIGALEGNTYNIRYAFPQGTPSGFVNWDHFLNGGQGVSGIRILGNRCKVKFMNRKNLEECILDSGDYQTEGDWKIIYGTTCRNDKITHFEILQGSQGKSILKNISHIFDYISPNMVIASIVKSMPFL